MPKFSAYQCSLCHTVYDPVDIFYTCPKDGGNLDVILDYEEIKRTSSPESIFASSERSIWRYLPLLPVSEVGFQHTSIHQVGSTPVYQFPRLAQKNNLPTLFIKDESRNPTASFKDRASAIVVARAKEIQAETIVTASTGNAGAALAGMAAAASHKTVIFAPKTAPPAKVAQLLVFGAQVILVDGNYDSAFDLTIQAASEFGWYCRNTGYNPFTLEGKKTAAFEVWEWWHNLPQTETKGKRLSIFVSVGDGNIISGLHKGFKDLVELGWLADMPRINGVQASGSAAIANSFRSGGETIDPVQADTLADSISVDLPRDGVRAVRAARQTHGDYITVEDGEILLAIAELGKMGIFAEPAGATSYAGLVQAARNGRIAADEMVLVINTGSGLKDIKAAMQAVQEAAVITPNLDALKDYLHEQTDHIDHRANI